MGKKNTLKQGFKIKSLFFRLFASIMAITVLILIIQIGVVSLMTYSQSKKFAQEVFSSYESRLNELLANESEKFSEEISLEDLGFILRAAADDRISGLMLHDENGNMIVSMGRTPRGFTIGDVAEAQEVPERKGIPEQDWYVRSEIDNTEINKDVPPIRPQDIAGTIPLYSDIEKNIVIGSVDVMVLNPLNYEITAMLFDTMLSGFIITILIALIIAFFGSHTIAQTVSRYAVKIVRTLEDIAQGHYKKTSYQSTLTELTQIEDSVETLKKKLDGHERMRQQWLRGIAHDLNTPLTALKLSIESAIDNVVPLDKTLLEHMYNEHEELEHRVEAVMTLASMESPDFHMDFQQIELLDFVDEVISSALSTHKVVLKIQVDHIDGNRQLLVLIARELINNGCKYAPNGSPIKWIIEKDEQSEEYIMRFTNKGYIDPDTIEHVFDPWFRSDQSRSKSGSGMGLAIVRQVLDVHRGNALMEQHGDEIEVVLRWPQTYLHTMHT